MYLLQSSWSGLYWDWWKWNYLFHLMQIVINHLKSVRIFVFTFCQTLRFAKYVIFFEVFTFTGKWKQRFGETTIRILLLKLVGPGLSKYWLITLIGLLKNLKQANHKWIANKKVFLIKIFIQVFLWFAEQPSWPIWHPFCCFLCSEFLCWQAWSFWDYFESTYSCELS